MDRLREEYTACIPTNSTVISELPRLAPWLLGLASLHGLLGLQAIIANWTVFSFYASRIRELVPFMYLAMSGCDIVTGCAALLSATIYMALVLLRALPHETGEDLPGVLVVLSAVHCVLIMLTARVSVAYNVLLAVVRTRALTRPFAARPMRAVVTTALAVPVLLCPLIGLQVHYFLTRDLVPFLLFTPYLGAKWLGFIGLQLNILLPFVIPSMVALACMVLQSWALVKGRVRAHGSDNQREVTKTIVLLTLLFFVCNTTFAVAFYVDTFTLFVTCLPSHLRFVAGAFFTATLTTLNAAANPVILVARGTRLREFAFGSGGGGGTPGTPGSAGRRRRRYVVARSSRSSSHSYTSC